VAPHMNDVTDTKSSALTPMRDLLVLAPLLGTGVAIAYNFGYFLAFDIDYFSFFSLTEHIVFALSALPIALVGVITGYFFVLMFANAYRTLPWEERFRGPIFWVLTAVFGVIGIALSSIGMWGFGMIFICAAMLTTILTKVRLSLVQFTTLVIPMLLIISAAFGRDIGSEKKYRPDRTHVLVTTGEVEGSLRPAKKGYYFISLAHGRSVSFVGTPSSGSTLKKTSCSKDTGIGESTKNPALAILRRAIGHGSNQADELSLQLRADARDHAGTDDSLALQRAGNRAQERGRSAWPRTSRRRARNRIGGWAA
jgi:hypothetical protein